MAEPLINVQIANLDEIIGAFKSAPSLMRSALPNAINKALLTIGREAMKDLEGAVYQTPASPNYQRTGNLLRSILNPAQGLQIAGSGVFSGSVGSGVGYGLFVEAGTKFMEARPFLLPAVADSESQVQGIFVSAVQGVLNKIASSAR